MIKINSLEIKEYLENKNFELNIDEFMYITDNSKHNVVNRVLYNHNIKCYEMWTIDDYYFKFNIKEKQKKKSLI